MEPAELNGGRFYLRPLHDDDRIDDRPLLTTLLGGDQHHAVRQATEDWHTGSRLTWAVCEQTWIDMAALVVAEEQADGSYKVCGYPVGDPTALVPNPDDLERKTYQDAADEGKATVLRWITGYLQRAAVDGQTG
ncbi:hypothetical protein ACFPVT_02565 [Corynebacterium choanae]|nr:hypothetical protein [Corynebacterium choanae]